MRLFILTLTVILQACSLIGGPKVECEAMNDKYRKYDGYAMISKNYNYSSLSTIAEIMIKGKRYAISSYYKDDINKKINFQLNNLVLEKEEKFLFHPIRLKSYGLFVYDDSDGRCFYEIEYIDHASVVNDEKKIQSHYLRFYGRKPVDNR